MANTATIEKIKGKSAEKAKGKTIEKTAEKCTKTLNFIKSFVDKNGYYHGDSVPYTLTPYRKRNLQYSRL